MKLLQRLVQQIEQPYMRYGQRLWTGVSSVLQKFPATPQTVIKKVPQSSLVFVVTVLSLTSALGHRFYNAPQLGVGREAPQTIYAPANATVEDKKVTEDRQKTARKNATSVLKLDPGINQQIRDTLQQHLDQGNDVRKIAGSFPFVETATLSVRTQTYLRKASEAEWQEVLGKVQLALGAPQAKRRSPTAKGSPTAKNNQIKELSDPTKQQALRELIAYRRSAQLENYTPLIQAVTNARSQYASALGALAQQPSDVVNPIEHPKSVYSPSLLDLADSDWQKIQAKARLITERILAQGIAIGLPQSILKDAINLQVKGSVPPGKEPILTQLLLASLQPNLILDEEQTRLLAEQAAQEVEPEFVSIRKGEMIVRAGETISSTKFALLDHFKLSQRGINWPGLLGFGALVAGTVGGFGFLERRFQPKMRRRDRVLIGLLCLSTPLLVALQVPSTNLPALGMLVGSFYGSPLGITVTGLMTVMLATGVALPWSHLLSSAAGGLAAGWLAGRLRSREELALLGTGISILQGVLYLVLNVASGTVWYTLLGSAAIHALLGLAWCIVAIGSSPYLEQVFDLVTTIRLVELANPNRPLLKQLAAKTPGTFQHTLFVATLAEAAARALGCNVELVRTGTLYHDIGKMHDPLGFIENQMGGPNKHDLIDDPWQSVEIIKKHVTEGIVMARKYRLPKAVQAFIPEHQGTMLIAYFYHQAQQRVQQAAKPDGTMPEVREADFRYTGPAPRSRETGIVMLADSCEAALRSLKDATHEEALSMINKILRARWQDKQLEHSGLTRAEMAQIATIFVDVWQQFNHQRIAYPKLGPNSQPALRPEKTIGVK